ncbi:MAG: glycosyltransferase [Kiritimatiellae bacterium]|nr:glycosyltransferase [Kiritimatiellia bacterium]
MAPLLSIVIANYNYGRFLPEALESVLSQSCGDFELIIVDGGSTDDSVEVIKRYANAPGAKIAWWVSEPDKGQSDAFNKGFARARGRFLTWLNADDVMLPGTVEELKAAAEKFPAQEWFTGGCLWLDPEMRVIRCGRSRRMSWTRAFRGLVNVGGPSSFFTKDLFSRAGGMDVRCRYTMDTDLWLRFALKEGRAFRPFIRYAWGLRLHPEAKMSGHNFSADGKFAAGAFTAESAASDGRKAAGLKAEREMTAAKLPPLRGGMNTALSLLTADHLPALLSRWDTARFKGRHYTDVPGVKR